MDYDSFSPILRKTIFLNDNIVTTIFFSNKNMIMWTIGCAW